MRVANGSTISSGRVVRPRMPRRWLPRVQVVEYLRAFMVGRSGWSALGGLLIICGAFGRFRKDVLLQVGGLATDCIGEDAALVVRIHRWLGDSGVDGRVVFIGEPVARTEAPESREVLRKQRRRWHRGLTDIMGRHRGMLLRPKYGVAGMVMMPWFLLFELLAPFVGLLGFAYFAIVLVLLGLQKVGLLPVALVDVRLLAGLFAASVLYTVLMTFASPVTEELSYRKYTGLRDLAVAIRGALEESLGYRPLNAWWRMGGTIEAVRKVRPEWGDMKRKGFSAS